MFDLTIIIVAVYISSSWRAMTGVKPRSGGQVSSWSRVMGHS